MNTTKSENIGPYLIIADVSNCGVCGKEHNNVHFYQIFDIYQAKCPVKNMSIYFDTEERP